MSDEEGPRLYDMPDGSKAPSVTTILSVIHKPGLVDWIGRLGLAESTRQRNIAADFGTRVHAGVEAICKNGEIPLVEDEIKAHVDRFYGWMLANVAEVIASELTLHSLDHRYAGTADAVVRLIDGTIAICDWKTSSMTDDSFGLQLEAYRRALLEEHGVEAATRIVVRVPRKDPKILDVHEFTDPESDWRAFLAASILWWKFASHDAFNRAPIAQRASQA